MVEEELRLASGDKLESEMKDEKANPNVASTFVTSDGTYASQSAFSSTM